MSRDDLPPGEAPPRLIEGGEPAGEALRVFKRRSRADGLEEAAAWRRLSPRVSASGARRWLWSGVFVAAGAAAALLIVRRPPAPPIAAAPPAPAVVAPAGVQIEPVPSAVPTPRRHAPRISERLGGGAEHAYHLALSTRPQALPQGHGTLSDEAEVELAPASKARATADAAWVRVLLDRGEVGLHVAKRVAGGPGFEVVAGDYHFRVLGTRFRVARGGRGGAPVELWVDEGRVAVSRGERVLGVYEAGGHWDARPQTASRPARVKRARVRAAMAKALPPAPRDEAAPPEEAPSRSRCATLATAVSTTREAVTCYLGVARGDGLAAETALYEVARLRRDVLGDGAGALEALHQSRARFPAGMLRQEVDLSIVELLPKLNRHHEAIDEIGRLLAQGGGIERGVDSAAELHMLRGNIYREVLEDFARAERDYADAEEARAPVIGDATFFRGVCLQALGRADEARASFDRYLAAGQRRFKDETLRRLERLGR